MNNTKSTVMLKLTAGFLKCNVIESFSLFSLDNQFKQYKYVKHKIEMTTKQTKGTLICLFIK